jgi:anti-sigma factor RsiW
MKPEYDMKELHAFVDDELSLEARLAVERRVEGDPVVRAQVEQLRALRSTVRENAEYHTAPDALRERLRALASAETASTTASATPASKPVRSSGVRSSGWASWLTWRPMGMAFATALVAIVSLQFWLPGMNGSAGDTRMRDDVIASHVRSTLGDRLVDVASSDHHKVKPYLSSKLDFSPPVRDSGIGDATFDGARVDYVDGRPVAALVYRKGGHVVDEFVWPSTAGDKAPSYSIDRGYQIAHWTQGGMAYWAISDVSRTEFGDLVKALSSGEASH